MKTATIFAALVGVCIFLGAVWRPSFVDHFGLNTSGGLSHWLTYTVEFHPSKSNKEAEFVVRLMNVSPHTLSTNLNDKKFHSSFVLRPTRGAEYQIFDKEYLNMLRTSIWSEPGADLAPSDSITWRVPLTSLVGEFDQPVTEESLSGCSVSSEMSLGILPKQWMAWSYVSDNATQTSQSIQIP